MSITGCDPTTKRGEKIVLEKQFYSDLLSHLFGGLLVSDQFPSRCGSPEITLGDSEPGFESSPPTPNRPDLWAVVRLLSFA